MQSVGEAMAIGRTFKQAFVKALRSRELDVDGTLPEDANEDWTLGRREALRAGRSPPARRAPDPPSPKG
jgi:carbamoyl-phosphate synthase large subunit